ncbi:MAG: hypothetical protein BRC42_15520 [Cyanobacteria bacterium QS_1_48_34]|nr:MAG: hypothetical protein BRC42_15520 [Cyanobacteria bacterium QS_1_48_34]
MPLLEINCPSYTSWRQMLQRGGEMLHLLRKVAGSDTNIQIHCQKEMPESCRISYQFYKYRNFTARDNPKNLG